ncbi:MAG: PEGA domain-containing protein [Candidatus Saccharimonadales bacterium]
MDFLDPRKKRALRHRLIAGYFLIGIAIGLVSLILIFQSYGYDLDRKTGAIIQNGLLFVSASPEPADIYLNNELFKTQSNARLVLPSAVYKLELKRSGYRPWQKTVSLAGGSIDRLVYPFLFPVKLDATDQKTYPVAPTFASQSPDRHWILVQPADHPDQFDVFDTTDFTKPPTVITLTAGLLPTASQHHLQLVEWSTDNRHVLLKDTYAGGSQFIMVDRQVPASSYNVNTTFKTSPTTVALHDKKFDQLYLYDKAAQTLSLGLQSDASLKLVASHVLAFKSYGNDILMYATDQEALTGQTRIVYQDKNGSFSLNQVVSGNQYLLNLAQYNGDWYVADGSAADGRIYIYKNPQAIIEHPSGSSQLYPLTVLRVDNPTWMEFSANTQFLAVESGSKFVVFDAERGRNYRYSLPVSLDPASTDDGAAPHANWMDDGRLIVNSGGKMFVTDYDGLNQQTLTANLPGMPALFNRDYTLLYNMAPAVKTPGQFALTRTDLIATKANQPKH